MNYFINKHYQVIFVIFLLIIISLSFFIGYQEGSRAVPSQKKDIIFSFNKGDLESQKISFSQEQKDIKTSNNGMFVGSRNGTKYYTPGCPGTNRINPENFVWFQSIEDATLQGYSKGSC